MKNAVRLMGFLMLSASAIAPAMPLGQEHTPHPDAAGAAGVGQVFAPPVEAPVVTVTENPPNINPISAAPLMPLLPDADQNPRLNDGVEAIDTRLPNHSDAQNDLNALSDEYALDGFARRKDGEEILAAVKKARNPPASADAIPVLTPVAQSPDGKSFLDPGPGLEDGLAGAGEPGGMSVAGVIIAVLLIVVLVGGLMIRGAGG